MIAVTLLISRLFLARHLLVGGANTANTPNPWPHLPFALSLRTEEILCVCAVDTSRHWEMNQKIPKFAEPKIASGTTRQRHGNDTASFS